MEGRNCRLIAQNTEDATSSGQDDLYLMEGRKGTGAYIDEYGWLWRDFYEATYRKSRARRDAVSSAESGRCANGDFSRDSGHT